MLNQEKPKILFIVGTSFSGSTLIGSSIIGDSVLFLGEIDRLSVFKRHEPAYMLDSCTICTANNNQKNCPVFTESILTEILEEENLVKQYVKLIKSTGQHIIIDSSKNPDWVANLVDNGLRDYADCFVMLAYRNPVAYAYSENDATNLPFWKAVVGWRETYHHAIRVLSHRAIPFVCINYEHLFVKEKINTYQTCLQSFLKKDIVLDITRSYILHAIGGNLGAYLNSSLKVLNQNTLSKNHFSSGDSWKLDKYQPNNPIESRRWLKIPLDEALSLLEIPGVVDMLTLLGSDLKNIIEKYGN